MDSKENWKKRTDFRRLLREKLIRFMISKNYQLISDNEPLSKDNQEGSVFKLVFEGLHTVEVSNDDWRDYTEYFNFYVNSKKIFTANIDNYHSADNAYDKCENLLEANIK